MNGTAVANGTNNEVDERTMVFESPSIGLPRPNPTEADAVLPIYLPTPENLRLELSDLTGKLLWVNDLQLEKGNHTLEIPASAMLGKGCMFGVFGQGMWLRLGNWCGCKAQPVLRLEAVGRVSP
ncbi:MAG: hypothetical protein IPH31_09860 [Lewinellaceae bacterium]|nr:hypothetical protein [Lewinellaceae bacterium]